MEIAAVLFVVAVIFVVRALKVVPQQHAWVVERLGRYHAILTPGLNILIPFVDRVAYKHSLKEIPLDVPSQVCITRDNSQIFCKPTALVGYSVYLTCPRTLLLCL